MNESAPQIKIDVDPINPGQFFACCGLLELADRLTGKAQGWFEKDKGEFVINAETNLETLTQAIIEARFEIAGDEYEVDETDKAKPFYIKKPFDIRIDWWKIPEQGISGLKTWAGSMDGFRIAQAMQKSIPIQSDLTELFDFGVVCYNPNDGKKAEPFYFDARRGPNAHPRDVGFSPNDLSTALGMKTIAYPSVEFLCLVGLQRARPVPLQQSRHYRYHAWGKPLSPILLPPAVMGLISPVRCYEFESWFRTGQKKHKAFLPATLQPV